jgi:hypothetical protein
MHFFIFPYVQPCMLDFLKSCQKVQKVHSKSKSLCSQNRSILVYKKIQNYVLILDQVEF